MEICLPEDRPHGATERGKLNKLYMIERYQLIVRWSFRLTFERHFALKQCCKAPCWAFASDISSGSQQAYSKKSGTFVNHWCVSLFNQLMFCWQKWIGLVCTLLLPAAPGKGKGKGMGTIDHERPAAACSVNRPRISSCQLLEFSTKYHEVPFNYIDLHAGKAIYTGKIYLEDLRSNEACLRYSISILWYLLAPEVFCKFFRVFSVRLLVLASQAAIRVNPSAWPKSLMAPRHRRLHSIGQDWPSIWCPIDWSNLKYHIAQQYTTINYTNTHI